MTDQTDGPGPARPQEPPWEPAQRHRGRWWSRRAPSWASGRSGIPACRCLTWVDINAGRLHRYTPGDGERRGDRAVGRRAAVPIGAAAHRGSGGYVLAAADGFRLAGPDGAGEAGPWRPAGMPDDVRFNDGACDPAGRFWAGTARPMTSGPAGRRCTGSTRTDRITTVLDGVTESNGLGWSPDGIILYYIDSGEHRAAGPGVRLRHRHRDASAGALRTHSVPGRGRGAGRAGRRRRGMPVGGHVGRRPRCAGTPRPAACWRPSRCRCPSPPARLRRART